MKRLLIVLALLLFTAISLRAQNTEVQDETDITSPVVGDDLYIVDDPDGAPASKKINIGALLDVMSGDVSSSTGVTVVADDSHNHVIANIDSMTSSALAGQISDETGTGLACFATSPVFTTDISIGSAGVKLSDDGDGAITFLGLGDGFDEDLIMNLDDVENRVSLSSSTGVNSIEFSNVGFTEFRLVNEGGAAGASVSYEDNVDQANEWRLKTSGGGTTFILRDQTNTRNIWQAESDGTLQIINGLYFNTAYGDDFQLINGTATFANGSGLSGTYRPYQFDFNLTATDLVTTDTITGFGNTINYGLGGVAAKGTAHANTFETVVHGNGDANNEQAVNFGVLRYDLGTGFTQTGTPTGRGWFADFNIHSPVGIQPDMLNGITLFYGNYYNGSPADSNAAGMWLVTKQAQGGSGHANHGTATSYPVDVGLGIVGNSGSVSDGGSGHGWETAIQIGGIGSGWLESGTESSDIGTGIAITDYNDAGISITGRHTSGTGPPIIYAGQVEHSVQAGVTANVGSTQGTGEAITSDIVEISVSANAGDALTLPTAIAGLDILIINHGANSADIFPNTSDAINEGSVNIAKALAADASMRCVTYDDTNWECLTMAR